MSSPYPFTRTVYQKICQPPFASRKDPGYTLHLKRQFLVLQTGLDDRKKSHKILKQNFEQYLRINFTPILR